MNKNDVRTPADALAYLTDCTLATVVDMAGKKSRKKHEYLRQIAIAQRGLDWMIFMGVSLRGTRAEIVNKNWGGVVDRYAKAHEPTES